MNSGARLADLRLAAIATCRALTAAGAATCNTVSGSSFDQAAYTRGAIVVYPGIACALALASR